MRIQMGQRKKVYWCTVLFLIWSQLLLPGSCLFFQRQFMHIRVNTDFPSFSPPLNWKHTLCTVMCLSHLTIPSQRLFIHPQAVPESAYFLTPLPIQFVNMSVLKALYMYCQIAFQKGCISVHSHQPCVRILFINLYSIEHISQEQYLPVSNSNLLGILSECLSPQGHKMAALPLQRSLSYSVVGFWAVFYIYKILVEIVSHGQDCLPDRPGNVVFSQVHFCPPKSCILS